MRYLTKIPITQNENQEEIKGQVNVESTDQTSFHAVALFAENEVKTEDRLPMPDRVSVSSDETDYYDSSEFSDESYY